MSVWVRVRLVEEKGWDRLGLRWSNRARPHRHMGDPMAVGWGGSGRGRDETLGAAA